MNYDTIRFKACLSESLNPSEVERFMKRHTVMLLQKFTGVKKNDGMKKKRG